MVSVRAVLGFVELLLLLGLIREVFGIGYDGTLFGSRIATNEASQDADANVDGDDDAKRGRQVGRSKQGRQMSGRQIGGESLEEDLDSLEEEENALDLSFDNMEAVGQNLASIVEALDEALADNDEDRVVGLATRGLNIIRGESSSSQGVQAYLDQSEELIDQALDTASDVKDRLEELLVKASAEARVVDGANRHSEGVSGILCSDIEAFNDIPDGFFDDKAEAYRSATSDDEKIQVWKDAYQRLADLPQFHPPSWTDPRNAARGIDTTVEAGGETRDKLLDEILKMQEKYETVKETLPDDVSVNQDDAENERELKLLNQAMSIVETHHQFLQDTADSYHAGGIELSGKVRGPTTTLNDIVSRLEECFAAVKDQARREEDVSLDELKEALQQFIQVIGELHNALQLYTQPEGTEETVERVKEIAKQLREQRRSQ